MYQKLLYFSQTELLDHAIGNYLILRYTKSCTTLIMALHITTTNKLVKYSLHYYRTHWTCIALYYVELDGKYKILTYNNEHQLSYDCFFALKLCLSILRGIVLRPLKARKLSKGPAIPPLASMMKAMMINTRDKKS